MEVYVQKISGVVNTSLMELANTMVRDIGGTVKFWQNKAIDIATYTCYHSSLSVWEPNRVYESFLGLPPHLLQNIRKKRGLAKILIQALVGICKGIDKLKEK